MFSGKLPYHLTSNRNFRIFWPNGKHPRSAVLSLPRKDNSKLRTEHTIDSNILSGRFPFDQNSEISKWDQMLRRGKEDQSLPSGSLSGKKSLRALVSELLFSSKNKKRLNDGQAMLVYWQKTRCYLMTY